MNAIRISTKNEFGMCIFSNSFIFVKSSAYIQQMSQSAIKNVLNKAIHWEMGMMTPMGAPYTSPITVIKRLRKH